MQMKLKWIVVTAAIALGGCSEEAKEDMKDAAEHAKQAAESAGKAISGSTKEVNDKWTEMNKDRHQVPEEDTGLPKPVEGDWDKMKQTLSDAKDVVVEKVEEVTADEKKSD